ncbi:hypothetical protein [Cellulomonas humilata]|uniref:Uncharacterized protein n=1 Tax=Cellulomonas humilata TaxID=144055 RepID=A0ABU0EFC7_9CELL|nr:hypothetical protein [Cellulomonas humilata]MDQ0373922.1 hypothetical protein [Cellulomonas humilata]
MSVPTALAPPPAQRPTLPVPDPVVRHGVAQILTQAEAFRALPPEDQKEIAKNTALIADYLARPEGIQGNRIPQGLANAPARALADGDASAPEATWGERVAAVDAVGGGPYQANAAREGAAVAGLLLREVKFPTFVAGLIEGVFSSIVKSSIEQMRAYQDMIAAVAQSLHQFMDDHVSPNQGRDNMVDQFPDLFEIGTDEWGDSAEPRLKLRDGVDEADALQRVNNKLEFENGSLKSLDLSDENVEKALVENSRIQLARQRQQLMASLVLMGINRIVVTDGRISAKIIYDVRSQDRLTRRRSATAMDVARDKDGRVQTTYAGEGKYDQGGTTSRSRSDGDSQYDADYFAKGEYKYENKPIITAQTSASETSDAALQTKIQLTGAVDVNFKSDYLPLDRMATPQMIATIQGNATPADPNVVPSPKAPAPGTAAPGASTTAGTVAPPPGTAPSTPTQPAGQG